VNKLQLCRRVLVVALGAAAVMTSGAASPTAVTEHARPGHAVGIDVSHWQGTIRWRRVAADGVKFVFAKATEAQGFVDPQYARNRERATAAGILFSAYHFARPDRTYKDAVREADHFVRTARLTGQHLLPVLDLESTGGLSPRRLFRWVQAWVRRVESRLGVKPIIYTGFYFWRDNMRNTQWFAKNGNRIWVAHWHVANPRIPAANWAGRGWSVWQRTNCGRVAGIRGCVDVDLYRAGDIGRLRIRNLR
jgi:lysozyme